MKKLPFDELFKETENIYESVVIMAKRARQINNEQKLEIEMSMETPSVSESKENEDFDDVEIDREALMREHKKFPKPSRLAIQEMIGHQIAFHYKDTEEEE